MTSPNRSITLNNGVRMPVLGFGVYQVPEEQAEQVVTGEATGRREFDQSLQRLGLDYLDLYLIHQPLGRRVD